MLPRDVLLLFIFALAVSEITHEGGSCGPKGVPYKVFVDRNGRPEIYCDNPQCEELPAKRGPSAQCSSKYLEKVCHKDDEWTGGLLEINNGTHKILKTQCCTYEGLRAGSRYKDVLLEASDGYTGGIVKTDSTPSAFDVVKEIRKTVTSENKVQYLITIYRMPCTGGAEDESHFRVKARVRRRMTSTPSYEYDDLSEYPATRRRYRPGRAARRRQQTRRPYRGYEYDEIYDYDYPMPPPRRGQRYRNRYETEERLWPVAYPSQREPRRRAYGVDLYDTEEQGPYPPPYTGQRTTNFLETSTMKIYSRALAAKLAREAAEYAPAPLAAQPAELESQYVPSNGLASQSLAPASPSYDTTFGGAPPAPSQMVNVQPQMDGPLAPPVYSTMGGSQYGQAPASFSSAVFPSPSGCSSPMGCAPGPVGPAPTGNSYAVAPPAYNTYATANQAPAYPSYQPSYPSYPSSYSYPSYYSGQGLNSVFDRMQCFSRNMDVETPTGTKKVSDLKIGDMILSIDEHMIQFSPVVMFLHHLHDEPAEFNRITMENGEFIELTDEHLIYVSDCMDDELHLVHSREVKPNHCIHAMRPGSTHMQKQYIRNITKVQDTGIYSPLTASGDIFVNGVLASCHSNLGLKTLQQTFFSLHRKVQTWLGWHTDHERSQLPYGVAYLTTVLDLFLPKQFF